MGMTLKELLTKGEGTISAKEAKALAAQCRMDEETLYTLLEERGISRGVNEFNKYEFYVSDAAEKFKQFANSVLPYDVGTIRQINIEDY